MAYRPSMYRAYVLRLWQEYRAGSHQDITWRFSLEEPHSGERVGFTTLEALISFLQTMTVAGVTVIEREEAVADGDGRPILGSSDDGLLSRHVE